MAGKRKPVVDMSYQKFGTILLDTKDLDPVYVMLGGAALPDKILARFLVAYWCFYHSGVSAYIAESDNFYRSMWKCATAKVPRGMERRHFWSKVARNAIQGLQDAGDPEYIVEDMCAHTKFWDVYKAVVKYNGFGPWMAWKIADMAERVLRYPVDFSDSDLGIYKDPMQGAAFIRFGDRYHPILPDELRDVCEEMVWYFSDRLAPPWDDRPVNIQEVETVLCKYKAHCYGAYPLGNDSIHMAKGMREWGDLAQELHRYIPIWEEIQS